MCPRRVRHARGETRRPLARHGIGEQDDHRRTRAYPISEIVAIPEFPPAFRIHGHELGNRLSTLVSLNFGHHLIKDGTYCTIGGNGAGIAQQSGVHAFMRGAGKQYGVPGLGNASIFSRWGYEPTIPKDRTTVPSGFQRRLLKRLVYSHSLQLRIRRLRKPVVHREALCPSGSFNSRQNRGSTRTACPERCSPGGDDGLLRRVVVPRHLYTGNVYRVWGNIVRSRRLLTDNVLDMLYRLSRMPPTSADPGSYRYAVRRYRGLLTDAPEWLLRRYAVLVLTGKWPEPPSSTTLEAYVAQGGHGHHRGKLAQFSRAAGSNGRFLRPHGGGRGNPFAVAHRWPNSPRSISSTCPWSNTRRSWPPAGNGP